MDGTYHTQITLAKRRLRTDLVSNAGSQLSEATAKRMKHKFNGPVLAYLPFNDEVDITVVLQSLIQVYLPVVNISRQIVSLAKYRPDNPIDLEISQDVIQAITLPNDLKQVLVPGLAFDQAGYRLGRGGGAYDRFLYAYPHLYRIGIITHDRFLPSIPHEPHDQAMDELWVVDAKGDCEEYRFPQRASEIIPVCR